MLRAFARANSFALVPLKLLVRAEHSRLQSLAGGVRASQRIFVEPSGLSRMNFRVSRTR